MNEKEEHTMRACTEFFEDIENLSCRAENLGEVIIIAAKLISLQREKNLEGLQALSQRLGVDVTSPVLDLAAAMKLVLQTIQQLQQKKSEEQTRGNFLEAHMVAILQDMMGFTR